MSSPEISSLNQKRIAVFSRYQLVEQYDLAAEFKLMLTNLAEQNAVLHLSFRNTRMPEEGIPDGLELAELPIDVDRQNSRDIMLKTMLMYLCLPLAAWKLRRYKPDVIFVSEILPLCGLFLKLCCNTRVATAYGDWHVHNFFQRKKWSRLLVKLAEWLEQLEIRYLDGFFCRARSAGDRLMAYGASKEQIQVVNDAPDLSAFFNQDQSALRQRCGFAEDDLVLLYHGVMHQGKGLDYLLQWTADLYGDDKRIGIIMVGAGPELAALKELAKASGLGKRAVFTGWLRTVQEVGQYCNAADICVAMRTGAESNVHIIPGALLHSMACRKTVMAPDLPGIREVIRDGVNGFLFHADDGASFKHVVRLLAADRSLCEQVAERAETDILERFSVAATASKYADAIIHFASCMRNKKGNNIGSS